MAPKSTVSPSSTTKDNIALTKPQQDTLTHLANLLHLFHHRNKNQHRRALWYRHFATFRKQLDHLNTDIAALHAVPATHAARVRKKREDVVLLQRIADRVTAWRDVFVRKWHLAFSQVVADGRFAVLGVVLLAVLAEVCAVVGVTEGLEREGEERVRCVIERFGREVEGLEGAGLSEREVGIQGGRAGGEDVGVAVERVDRGAGEQATVDGDLAGIEDQDLERGGAPEAGRAGLPDATSTQSAPQQTTHPIREAGKTPQAGLKKSTKRAASSPAAKPTKKAKKRGKGDAIDDLFRGLG